MISFRTDAWTSPNSKAYIAVTAHFDRDGVPFSMLLDLVEVAQSHSGLNIAAAFAKVLDDFGISDKVSLNFVSSVSGTHCSAGTQHHLRQCCTKQYNG